MTERRDWLGTLKDRRRRQRLLGEVTNAILLVAATYDAVRAARRRRPGPRSIEPLPRRLRGKH